MPTTAIGKRRFICGYSQVILPACGIPDVDMRNGACASVIRVCFKELSLDQSVTRGILEYVTKQMLVHRSWGYQKSGLDILALFMRLKLPGLSISIAVNHIEGIIQSGHNTLNPYVKIGIINFLRTCLFVFPRAVAHKLEAIRDISR
jgi:hypothetical protein